MEKQFGYSRTEKLKQKRELTLLFEKGKWRTAGKIRIMICKNEFSEDCTINKVGVSVSKRYFKKATDRNRVKRLLREAYRFHKDEFSALFGNGNLCMIFWNSSAKPHHFSEVESEFLSLCKSKK